MAEQDPREPDPPESPAEPIDRRALLKLVPLGALGLLLDGRRTLDEARRILVPRHPRPRYPHPGWPVDPLADEGAGRSHGHGLLHKIRDFDRTFADDVLIAESRLELLVSTAARLERALRVIGHGNFNLVTFDQLLRYAERFEEIGVFPPVELDLLDELFHADATRYGFFGDKVLHEQTAKFHEREVKKIPRSGHYLLRGAPLEKYERIRRDLGDSIILTSGVRNVVKQYQLFLSKAVTTGGNLSQASRSLAPPGYSYHAAGDFDIGRVGFGLKNFTAEFAETEEYRRLIDLGYITIRYTETNPYGVRHEPWHIKIV